MIVDNIDILKKHVPTVAGDSVSFAELEEHVRAAESWLRNNISGSALYDFMEMNIEIPLHGMLLYKMQRVISLRGFENAVPMLNLVLTSAGFAVTNNEKVAPASKERVADLREGLKRECADAIEDMITFLETDETYTELWKMSPSYSFFSDTFLPTFMLFKNYAPYADSVASIFPKCRLDFAALRGKMRSVMAGKITGATGKKIVLELIDGMNSDTLSVVEKKLLEPLRFALAAYTLGLNDEGDSFINQALSIIKENADDFPDSGLNFGGHEWTDSPIINMC
ncbi:MAG: hypothetical protein LBS69_00205 [Prevotellaceae bacterium]|nr:hypothetical protein [Prevotellaceae bacterium]